MKPKSWIVVWTFALLTAACSQPLTQEAIPTSTPRPYRLQPGELILAADDGDIPAIFADDTLFVDVENGNLEWLADELVIGVSLNDESHAYSVRLLSLHEIVNDEISGHPIAVTWCPLCYSAIVFSRVVDEQILTFGVSGYLLKNNLVMFDHQSNTLWSQLFAQGLRGAHARQRLELIPSTFTTWGAWQETHPETMIISALAMGLHADQIIDPYSSYYTSPIVGISGPDSFDERLPGKTLIVGLLAGEYARAYPLGTLKSKSIINDHLDTLPIVLTYDPDLQTAIVYNRRIIEKLLTFESTHQAGIMRDRETGSLWEINTGDATHGPLSGATLTRLNAPLVFWFAWVYHYPSTDVYAQ